MSLLSDIQASIDARKHKALQFAEVGLTESQFRAFRGLFLDEFGRKGLMQDLERIVAEYERCQGTAPGKETGRNIHAGKEVPHA